MPDIQNIPTTQYIGPRIIPHLWDPILWDASTQYDALAVVQYEGAGYVARYVPPQGTLPTNTEYWVRWADFNAQLAQVEQQVTALADSIDGKVDDAELQQAVDTINASLEATDQAAADKTTLQRLVCASANYAPWKLIDTFRTYMTHRDQMHYGAGSILDYDYNESTNTFTPATLTGTYKDGVPTFGTSCSIAVQLALMGVPFETSRFASGTITGGTPPTLMGGRNIPISGASCLDIFDKLIHTEYTESDYVTYASELAHWLYDAGLLHERKLPDSLAELAPGDIMFYVTHDVDDPVYWKGIGHTSIYCGPWYTGGIVAETSSDEVLYRIRTQSAASLSTVAYYARIPMPGNEIPRNLISTRWPNTDNPDGFTWEDVTGLGYGHALPFDISPNGTRYQLKPRYVYTVLMHLKDIQGTGVRFAVNGRSYVTNDVWSEIVGNVSTANSACYLGEGWYYGVVLTPDTMPATIDGIFFRPNSEGGEYSVTLDYIAFYDRMMLPSPVSVETIAQ